MRRHWCGAATLAATALAAAIAAIVAVADAAAVAAAAVATHALSALMDRDLLCAWRSWSEWDEKRAAALRPVRRTMMKLRQRLPLADGAWRRCLAVGRQS